MEIVPSLPLHINSNPINLLILIHYTIVNLQVPRRSGNEFGHIESGDQGARAGCGPRTAKANCGVPQQQPSARSDAAVQDAADGHGVAGEDRLTRGCRLAARPRLVPLRAPPSNLLAATHSGHFCDPRLQDSATRHSVIPRLVITLLVISDMQVGALYAKHFLLSQINILRARF